MNSAIYRQYDSRWGSLPYPTKTYNMSGCGCGCCAVLHCIIERSKYAKYTPKTIQPYMKGFAVGGNGTLWSGIRDGLKHYGMDNVKWFGASATMTEIFAELKKGSRIGVILFGSTKGPDGTVWTTGGHYIAFTDYKIKNSKHYFYLKDSGGRKHDGWYCYEKSMKGDVRQVWTCTVPKEASTATATASTKKTTAKTSSKKTYSGTFPSFSKCLEKGDKGTQVKNLQKFLNWYGGYKLTVDGIYGSATVTAVKKFQKAEGLTADGIFGPASLKAAKKVKK